MIRDSFYTIICYFSRVRGNKNQLEMAIKLSKVGQMTPFLDQSCISMVSIKLQKKNENAPFFGKNLAWKPHIFANKWALFYTRPYIVEEHHDLIGCY